jgi:hypothetical protein
MSQALSLTWRLRAARTALLVPPLVRFASFTRVALWLDSRPRTPTPELDDAALASWVDRVLRWLPGPWHHTCLKRAAVLYRLLRRAGRPVELWIGVRRGSGQALAAHAWLVRDGTPYLEPDPRVAAAHTVIARFPEAGRVGVPCIPLSS